MRRTIVAAVALILTAFAQPAQGEGSENFPSFMNATCYTFDCSVVQFNLETDPFSYVLSMTWTLEGSAVTEGFVFDEFLAAESGSWAPIYLSDGSVQISAGGVPVETPAWFRLGMTGVESADQLATGEAVRYNGMAWETYVDGVGSGQVSLSGYVVPEPGTWAMMLTGLLLVGAAGFRRSFT